MTHCPHPVLYGTGTRYRTGKYLNLREHITNNCWLSSQDEVQSSKAGKLDCVSPACSEKLFPQGCLFDTYLLPTQ